MPPTVSVDQLGAELRRRRKALGASLRAVEESTEISAATLSRIERGSTPDLSIVERLASWLGVQVVASGGAPTEGDVVRTDADLRRTIEIHLRATKHMSDELARSIADTFDRIVRAEAERVAEGQPKGPQDER
ncbi:MAG: helix-turn-helix transcriptional regulator [Gemmatimonas sp.]|jgi:transcriptional regulator with XRE-family HTH domain|nr:helix-turn-helix transcriptional regulator [Gemmatimonas sp.]